MLMNTTDQTDFELLDRWRAGDNAAGNRLFQRHFDSVNRFFATKIGEDIDDLVQGTFYQLIRDVENFRRGASFRTYLFAIARHQFYRYLRGRSGRRDVSLCTLEALGTSPPSQLIEHERNVQLLRALRSLPLEHQLMIQLHYWEGMSMEALGVIFELEAPAVRARLYRARKKLRREMDKLSTDSTPAYDGDGLEAWAHSLRGQWAQEAKVGGS